MQNTKKIFKYDFKGQVWACIIDHIVTDNNEIMIASLPAECNRELSEATEVLLPAATKAYDVKWMRLVWIERTNDGKYWFVNFQPTGNAAKVYIQDRREVEEIDWLELNCKRPQ